MEQLLELMEQLKDELEKLEEVRKIKELKKKIEQEPWLLEQLAVYQKTKDSKLREQIYKNELYQEYKQAETDVNLLIIKLNQELKKIKNKGKCNL